MTAEDPGQRKPDYVDDDVDDEGAPGVEEVTAPPGLPAETYELLTKAAHRNALTGLVFGLIIIILGVVLIVLGVSGVVDFEIASGEIEAKLSTGVVGVVVAIIGLAVIYFTRFRVEIKQ